MYKCCFPGCNYETENRSLIEFHHVYPRELHVSLGKNVTIPLCSVHHKLIFHPDATSGQHSVKHPESMVVKGVTNSSAGKCVMFQDMDGNDYESYLDEKVCTIAIYRMSWNIIDGIKDSEADDINPFIESAVDKYGYYKDGNSVYYSEGNRKLAADLLHGIVAVYGMKVSAEYDTINQKIKDAMSELLSVDGS